jgi:superfamily I DNA and/or RNA helicase
MYVPTGSGRVVLVGDPCQLPPTVLSKAAEASMLAQSLFERLARAGWPVNMLLEQYRSHPAISAFPSRYTHTLCDRFVFWAQLPFPVVVLTAHALMW